MMVKQQNAGDVPEPVLLRRLEDEDLWPDPEEQRGVDADRRVDQPPADRHTRIAAAAHKMVGVTLSMKGDCPKTAKRAATTYR